MDNREHFFSLPCFLFPQMLAFSTVIKLQGCGVRNLEVAYPERIYWNISWVEEGVRGKRLCALKVYVIHLKLT